MARRRLPITNRLILAKQARAWLDTHRGKILPLVERYSQPDLVLQVVAMGYPGTHRAVLAWLVAQPEYDGLKAKKRRQKGPKVTTPSLKGWQFGTETRKYPRAEWGQLKVRGMDELPAATVQALRQKACAYFTPDKKEARRLAYLGDLALSTQASI